MSQEPPPLAPRIAEDDSDDEDPATELDAAGDTRRIIDGIIQPARTAGGPSESSSCWHLRVTLTPERPSYHSCIVHLLHPAH